VKIEVGLLEIDQMPDEIRSRPVDPVRVEQFKDFTIFKPSDIKGGYAIVNDAGANKAGFPFKDLADLKTRIQNSEEVPIYVIAGWHTTQALCYHKSQGHLIGCIFREFEYIWLASSLTQPEVLALGSFQNWDEQKNESSVSFKRSHAGCCACLFSPVMTLVSLISFRDQPRGPFPSGARCVASGTHSGGPSRALLSRGMKG
jgi:hypothetical protein